MTLPTSEFERSWRSRFERYAAVHDDDASIAGWSDSGLATRMRCFMRAWERTPESLNRESRWLDAGCGAGTYTRFLSTDGRNVAAIDYSLPSVRRARERASGDVVWAAADVTRLPFLEGSFDGVLCFGVMQALSSPTDAMCELRRVLVRGGSLWIDALNAGCITTTWIESKRRRSGLPPRLRYDEPEAFLSALRASAFESIKIHWAPIMPSPLRVLQPLLEHPALTAMLGAFPQIASRLSHSMLIHARAS
jgi:SAM-dependent methyltransferase